jgi:hypothetical protein
VARSRREEDRHLSVDERELVALTHPELGSLPDDRLADAVGRLRDRRARARDIASRQRREMRGKAAPAGATPAAADAGSRAKAAVLAAALKRANKEMERRPAARARGGTAAGARRALAMKRAAEDKTSRPESHTAGEGMHPVPNDGIAPSGALGAEGYKPVLERSREVR